MPVSDTSKTLTYLTKEEKREWAATYLETLAASLRAGTQSTLPLDEMEVDYQAEFDPRSEPAVIQRQTLVLTLRFER